MDNLEWLESHNKPNIYQGIKIAKELGMDASFACNARRRYLMRELELYEAEYYFYRDFDDSLVDGWFCALQNVAIMKNIIKIRRELRAIKKVTVTKQEITDDMIEMARAYPVSRLIEFSHGKAKAWCHEDKNPSMYHATRGNFACCPVCDKKFDSIAVLMDRDGMTFKAAVTQLSGV